MTGDSRNTRQTNPVGCLKKLSDFIRSGCYDPQCSTVLIQTLQQICKEVDMNVPASAPQVRHNFVLEIIDQ